MDYIELGPTPVDEDCAQTVHSDFAKQNHIECTAFKNQLQRTAPETPFMIRTFPYGSGTYREVCVEFDPDDEESCDRAFAIEGSVPDKWDEAAVEELKAAGYRHLKG